MAWFLFDQDSDLFSSMAKLEPAEPTKGSSFWKKPIEILLFGIFTIIFGLLLAVAGADLGSQASQYYNGNLWPFVFWIGIGIFLSGIGIIAGNRIGYVFSIVMFSIAYLTAIIQAFQRDFVWGIFLDPIVLSFLILPRIRTYFFKLQPTKSIGFESDSSPDAVVGQTGEATHVSPTKKRAVIEQLVKPSNLLTLVLVIGMFSIIPVVASSVHTVSVSQVRLDVLYPPGSNSTFPWFGPSTQTISAGGFMWGLGKIAISFTLDNLGLFQQHTVDWISVATPGFTLYSSGTPITVPDLASVTFHLILQAPDYDFSGSVILELHTS